MNNAFYSIFIFVLKGAIDKEGYAKVNTGALRTKAALDAGQYKKATDEWLRTEMIIMDVAKSIDFYNILEKVDSRPWLRSKFTYIYIIGNS